MPTESITSKNQAVILSELDQIKGGIKELKLAHKETQEFIIASSTDRATLRARIEEAHKRVDEHKSELDDMNKALRELTNSVEVLKQRVGYMVAIGGIVGGAVVLYVVNTILHSVFPLIP